jgi:peptide/nickel transport system substrate-binding protein
MYLNTRERPFDDPRVRRALAYAIDRKAVQAAYPSRSTITCQSLPPNFPGYAPYCPYTVSPDAAGTWTAPDMTKARDLVAASGTKGMDITLWTFEPFAGASEPFADALNRLGYHAEVKAVGGDDFFGFYSFLADSSNHAQGGGFWVTSPDPAPSEIFGFAATCDAFLPNDPNNGNASELCDTHVDAKFAKAVRVQATDPASARQAWADLDRTVTDLSPWIPVLVPEGVDFLSERVSNYQHNPAIGVLLDQLWVT